MDRNLVKFYLGLALGTWFGWLSIFTVLSFLTGLVSLFGIVWKFNYPDSGGWFWLKLGASASIVLIICLAIWGVIKKIDE